jgi:hypothetical protein
LWQCYDHRSIVQNSHTLFDLMTEKAKSIFYERCMKECTNRVKNIICGYEDSSRKLLYCFIV